MLYLVLFIVLYITTAVIHFGLTLHSKNIYSMKELNKYSEFNATGYYIFETKSSLIFDSIFWIVLLGIKVFSHIYNFICFCINTLIAIIIHISNCIRLYYITING